MLNEWLNRAERSSSPYSEFDVTDIEPTEELSTDHETYLAKLLHDAMVDPELFGAVALDLGWDDAEKYFATASLATRERVQRGDFGEALTGGILEQCFGYTIPVVKLRYKQSANQTQPGTDLLAFKLDSSSEIVEVCYVETKLRATLRYETAIEGYKQLLEAYQARFPTILRFIAIRLHENAKRVELYRSFRSYMKERRDTTSKDNFVLSLCWDRDQWQENVLENLQDNGVELPRLTVKVIRIADLRDVSDRVFGRLGVNRVLDE